MSQVAEYLTKYAAELSQRVEDTFEPLHCWGDRSYSMPELGRELIAGQFDATAAIVKLWRSGQRAAQLVGALGSGKTTVATASIHAHARGKPYRAAVMCPVHLGDKWVREIQETVPGASAVVVERYHELIDLSQSRRKPSGPEFIVVGESMAKLGAKWRPAFVRDPFNEDVLQCPCCRADIVKKTVNDDVEEYHTPGSLAKRRYACEECGEPLWQWTSELNRWPVASFIASKMKGMIDYAVIDEAHQSAAEQSMVANACGKLVNSARYKLTMTGTYMNGYAHSIMHLMWRTSPRTLVRDGFEFGQEARFAEQYGRLERVTKGVSADSNKTGPGSKGRTTVKVRPGVMPSLFSDHVLDKTVFLGLEDISDALPPMSREVCSVAMDDEQQDAYDELEDGMAEAVAYAMEQRDWSLVTRLVVALIGYPDHPYGWDEIGYSFGDQWTSIAKPKPLGSKIRPKEHELINFVCDEFDRGRKSWVFCEMTQKRDVQPRLKRLIEAEGLKVAILRSKDVPTKKREQWIAANAPFADVIISHPKLVETGLDFFRKDRRGEYRYNIPSLFFYQTGMQTSTLRQASGRAWRIGQSEACSVTYMHYTHSMQARLMDLISAKIQASEAIDGKFSEDGLSSLSNISESMGLALARQLLETMRQVSVPQFATAV